MATASLGCGGQAASNDSDDKGSGGVGGSSLTGTSGGSGGTGGTWGAPPEPGAARATCEQSSDCVVDQGCCGLCGVSDPADLIAVNQKYQSALMPECQDLPCGQCGTPAALSTFGAFCNAGSCEVFDVRASALSECSSPDDCRMRDGLNCCEGCGGSEWVAVSADLETLQAELCGANAVDCSSCGPGEHSMIVPICDFDGHCRVDRTLL